MHLCVRLCQHERALCLTLAHIRMLRASLFAHNVIVGSGREGQSWNYQTRLFCQRKKKLENKVNAWNDNIFESDWKCLVLLFSFGVCPTAEPQWENEPKREEEKCCQCFKAHFFFPSPSRVSVCWLPWFDCQPLWTLSASVLCGEPFRSLCFLLNSCTHNTHSGFQKYFVTSRCSKWKSDSVWTFLQHLLLTETCDSPQQ